MSAPSVPPQQYPFARSSLQPPEVPSWIGQVFWIAAVRVFVWHDDRDIAAVGYLISQRSYVIGETTAADLGQAHCVYAELAAGEPSAVTERYAEQSCFF